MKLCVPSPSSLRPHNASVMFCQVRHDGRKDDGAEILEGWRRLIPDHRQFFSVFSSLSLKLQKFEELDVEPRGTLSFFLFFSLHFSVSGFNRRLTLSFCLSSLGFLKKQNKKTKNIFHLLSSLRTTNGRKPNCDQMRKGW